MTRFGSRRFLIAGQPDWVLFTSPFRRHEMAASFTHLVAHRATRVMAQKGESQRSQQFHWKHCIDRRARTNLRMFKRHILRCLTVTCRLLSPAYTTGERAALVILGYVNVKLRSVKIRQDIEDATDSVQSLEALH